jgi:hypothetical protein
MTLTVVRAAKNLPWLRYEAEQIVEDAAARARARYATPGKHTVYDRKVQEATRYLALVQTGDTPQNLAKFPYMKREVGPGKTAATALELANLWVEKNALWEDVSANIEEISVVAKAQARAAVGKASIDAITNSAVSSLDAIGDPPPQRPNKSSRRP